MLGIGSTFMESSPFLLLFLLGYCLAVIEGELRCYCNESGCVSTGYMCKSSAGQCFTAVEIRDETTHQTHGCLDNLPKEHQASCRIGVDVISTNNVDLGTGHLPFLMCCTEHMCNYREDIDISIILTPKYNGTFHRGRLVSCGADLPMVSLILRPASSCANIIGNLCWKRHRLKRSAPAKDDYAIYSRNHHSIRDDDRELWFKAAVIAVPIAGGFILVLLVLLAVRMLRTDTRHHRRLIHIRRERSLTKAHMYISDHFSNKSNKHHFSLFNDKSSNTFTTSLQSNKLVTVNKGNNSTRNSVCQPSPFKDNSNSFCTYSLSRDISNKSDILDSGTNSNIHCHTSLPCNSIHSCTSHVTCSTSGDSQSSSTNNITNPCSFYIDTSFKNPCLTVKVNKDGQVISQTSRQDYYGTHSESGYQNPSVAAWDDTSLTDPTAAV